METTGINAVDSVIAEVVRRLRDNLDPVAIYLFGSHAEGRAHARSDLDILVVVEDSPLDFFERGARAYKALRGVKAAIDLQVYTRREFEERAALPVSFERTVRSKGTVLFAA